MKLNRIQIDELEPVFEYICFPCGKSFGRAYAFGEHVARAHPERNTETFQQQVCQDRVHEDLVLRCFMERQAPSQVAAEGCTGSFDCSTRSVSR